MREGSPHKQLPALQSSAEAWLQGCTLKACMATTNLWFPTDLDIKQNLCYLAVQWWQNNTNTNSTNRKIVVTSSSPAAATATSSSSTTCITVHIFCCHAVHRNPMQVNRRASQSSYFLSSHRAGEQSGFRVLGCSRTEESRQKKRRHTRTSGVAASSLVLC